MPGLFPQQTLGQFDVVEGKHYHIVEHAGRGTFRIGSGSRRRVTPVRRGGVQAHFGVVIGAVIGAFDLGDLLAAGEGPCCLQRHHDGFCAGVGETHLLYAGQTLAEDFSQLDFAFGGHAEAGPQSQLFLHRFVHLRMAVAVDHGGEVVDAVDSLGSIGVPDSAALATHRVKRERFHVDRRTGVAPRKDTTGTCMDLLGCRGVIGVVHTYLQRERAAARRLTDLR
ncbi:hypothetical protein D9M71_599880 [compost metagenome]